MYWKIVKVRRIHEKQKMRPKKKHIRAKKWKMVQHTITMIMETCTESMTIFSRIQSTILMVIVTKLMKKDELFRQKVDFK